LFSCYEEFLLLLERLCLVLSAQSAAEKSSSSSSSAMRLASEFLIILHLNRAKIKQQLFSLSHVHFVTAVVPSWFLSG